MSEEKKIEPTFRIIVVDVDEEKIVFDERCFSVVGGICANEGERARGRSFAFAKCTGDCALGSVRAAEEVTRRVRKDVESKMISSLGGVIKKMFGGKGN